MHARVAAGFAPGGCTCMFRSRQPQRSPYRCAPRVRQPFQRVVAEKEAAIKQLQSFSRSVSDALEQTDFKTSTRVSAAASVTAVPEGEMKALRELNKDDYYTFLEEAGDTLVVVDFYTDWCGPCKLMMPLLLQLADELEGKVHFVKMNCNAYNKDLGISLGVKVAPTFFLYKNSNKVAMMTGAKIEELKALVSANM